MMHILFISPAFANGGVVYKYDKRYLQSWSEFCDFTIATKKTQFIVEEKSDQIITSDDFFSHAIQIIQGRYFKGLEFVVPDSSRITISPFLLKTCRDFLKSHQVDAIHTVSFPCSSHLIGYELKKEFHLPWIAHFYDPWVDSTLRNIPHFLCKKDRKLEALVASYADAIIHSNNVITNCWIERYGNMVKDKLHVIPFGYSQEQVDTFAPFKAPLPQGKKIIVSYIGTCAGARNFQSIIKAIEIFAHRCPDIDKKLEIRLLGNLLKSDQRLIEATNLWNIFNFVGRKSHNELPKYYHESDVFLVIDATQKKNVFFPSKLVDYFYYQKPILGISPKIGVTCQFLKEAGHYCFENEDIQGIANYFQMLFDNFSLVLKYNKDYYQNFLPEGFKEKYKTILHSVIIKNNL